jgi:hypothetical protein
MGHCHLVKNSGPTWYRQTFGRQGVAGVIYFASSNGEKVYRYVGRQVITVYHHKDLSTSQYKEFRPGMPEVNKSIEKLYHSLVLNLRRDHQRYTR